MSEDETMKFLAAINPHLTPHDRNPEEYMRIHRTRIGCRHRAINDRRLTADIVSVLNQIPRVRCDLDNGDR